MKKIYTAIAAGVVLGIIGARFLFVGSWFNLIPWSLAGLAIGYWGTKNEAMIDGVVYGFVLSFVFMIAGYDGKASLISRVPFFSILGVFGGMCGLILGVLGFSVKTRIAKQKKRG
jgi:hypothetical protein